MNKQRSSRKDAPKIVEEKNVLKHYLFSFFTAISVLIFNFVKTSSRAAAEIEFILHCDVFWSVETRKSRYSFSCSVQVEPNGSENDLSVRITEN